MTVGVLRYEGLAPGSMETGGAMPIGARPAIMTSFRRDITRTMLVVLFIDGLIAA